MPKSVSGAQYQLDCDPRTSARMSARVLVLIVCRDVDAVQCLADDLLVYGRCRFVLFGTRLPPGGCCLRLIYFDAVGEKTSRVLCTKLVDERDGVLCAVTSYELVRMLLPPSQIMSRDVTHLVEEGSANHSFCDLL